MTDPLPPKKTREVTASRVKLTEEFLAIRSDLRRLAWAASNDEDKLILWSIREGENSPEWTGALVLNVPRSSVLFYGVYFNLSLPQ